MQGTDIGRNRFFIMARTLYCQNLRNELMYAGAVPIRNRRRCMSIDLHLLQTEFWSLDDKSAQVELLNDALPNADAGYQRCAVLDLLSFLYYTIDPAIGLRYAREIIREARSAGDRIMEARGCIRLANYGDFNSDKSTTARSLKRAGRLLADVPNMHSEKSFISRALADIELRTHGSVNLDLLADSLAHARQSDHPPELLNSLCAMAEGCLEVGLFSESLDLITECLDYPTEIPLFDLKARAQLCLGILHGKFERWEDAETTLQETLLLQERAGNTVSVASTCTMLGALYNQLGRYDEALNAFERAERLFGTFDLRDERATVLADIGRLHIHSRRFDQAHACLDRAEGLIRGAGPADRTRSFLAVVRGEIYAAQKRYREAVELIGGVLGETNRCASYSLSIMAHTTLAGCYEELGEYEQALIHHKKVVELEHRSLDRRVLNKLASLRFRDLIIRAENESEFQQKRADHLEEEVRTRTEESATLSLQIARTSTFLDRLRGQLVEFEEAGVAESRLIRNLIKDIERNANHVDASRVFEEQLGRLDRRFYAGLTERYPELTSAEIRICLLLRMNLSTVDIATLLNVSDRTVTTHRSHIRRKMGLKRNDSLISVLSGIYGSNS